MTSAKPTFLKTAAVVILYHPHAAFLSHIQSYTAFVDKVYVYDNTEVPTQNFDWTGHPKLVYHHNGQNMGIATRLNAAAAKAINEGYEWLLTMDQDSVLTQDTINSYSRCFDAFTNKENIALFGPEHFEKKQAPEANACAVQEVERIITSGALLNLSLFSKIGGFDEALFIDSVDWDYCIRARLAGYRIIQFPYIFMEHRIGAEVSRSSIKTLFTVKKQKCLHSPLRCYYMLRNLLYLQQKFDGRQVPVLTEIKGEVKRSIVNYLYYGRDSVNLVKHLLLAYRHFKEKRMGKL